MIQPKGHTKLIRKAAFSAFSCMSLLVAIYVLPAWMMPVPAPMDACISEVQNIYKKMDIKDLDKGDCVYMNFTMVTHYRETQQHEAKVETADIEYIVEKEKMQYRTKDMNVLMDQTDNFTIVPSRKTIFWSSSLLNVGKGKRVKEYQLLQDSIFSACKILSCKAETDKRKPYNKIVTMQPLAAATKKYPYENLIFYINTSSSEIKKIVVNYPVAMDFSQIEIDYNKIQHQYKDAHLTMEAKAQIFSADGKLLAPYTGYKVVDDRVKQKKK